MKKWNILNKFKIQNSKFKIEQLVDILLENRGIKTKKEKENFLNPDFSAISISSVGIDKTELVKSLKRIHKALKDNEQIIIFGDYDVDGICGSAILWETLNSLGAKVLPYIPSRFEEGYGLSQKGISNVQSQIPNISLIITVDNGIVANEAVEFAKKQGIDVIITDHHAPSKKLPKAYSIVHTTSICGAAVAYLLAKEISNKYKILDTYLELVALATIADLVPLTKENRTLVYFGLKALHKTKRLGLLALFKSAAIDKESIGVYEIGHIIAPRLNAMGRLENAMDSLRLVCTKDPIRAQKLSRFLSDTNLQRQEITKEALGHATIKAKDKILKNLIFIADKSYQQGVIGLIAGRLVEEYYLPAIVISRGERYSKASARSVRGFNIIEFLREASDLMVDLGGHPMAAGFTVETKKLELLEEKIYNLSAKLLNKDHLQRVLNIDLELSDQLINFEIFNVIQKLNPFGMANPEPTFLTRDLIISDLRIIGRDGKHLKLNLKPACRQGRSQISNLKFAAIAFGIGDSHNLKIGEAVDVVYALNINEWNGNKNLQLKIKDIRKN